MSISPAMERVSTPGQPQLSAAARRDASPTRARTRSAAALSLCTTATRTRSSRLTSRSGSSAVRPLANGIPRSSNAFWCAPPSRGR